MLEVLEDALADAPRWRPGAVALELTGPRTVLGQRGRPIGDPATHTFGFTRRQCVAMRNDILAAARADAGVGT
jgi:hypothetical protein